MGVSRSPSKVSTKVSTRNAALGRHPSKTHRPLQGLWWVVDPYLDRKHHPPASQWVLPMLTGTRTAPDTFDLLRRSAAWFLERMLLRQPASFIEQRLHYGALILG